MKQPKCSWCDKPATAVGKDGTYSCGYGQGPGETGDPHNTQDVWYTPLESNEVAPAKKPKGT